MKTSSLFSGLAVLLMGTVSAGAEPAPLVRNGGMEGPPTDHSDGKGPWVTPDGWTPVNVNVNRGDRLAVERSDRAGGGTCLHVRTFGSDAGVYQTIAPLKEGLTYLVSAWVHRLSGELALRAYSFAWGPAVLSRIDGASQGWTRLVVGLTPVDEGAHLYLVASPQADFLIDDVELRPAPVQVSRPAVQPYDFTGEWVYRAELSSLPGEAALPSSPVPREVSVQPRATGPEASALGPPQRVELDPRKPTPVAVHLPFAEEERSFFLEVTDTARGEVLGGSTLTPLEVSPWEVQYPYKDALFSSQSYRWPVRVSLQHAPEGALQRLRATATIRDKTGKERRAAPSRRDRDSLRLSLNGRLLPPDDYRLRLVVEEAKGPTLFKDDRPLRILPPGSPAVTFAPDGSVQVDGHPFFPIGLYWVFADPAAWKPVPNRKEAEFRELRQAGFNTLHTYAFEHNDENDTDENALAYLDTAQEFGFKVMMGLRREWMTGQDLNLAAIEERVQALRDHPALLCWTLWDEPDLHQGTPDWAERVQKVYDWVNRLDPYHPAMMVFAGPSGRSFRQATDAHLFDCYPGPGGAGTVAWAMARAQESLPDKPIWFVAQGHRAGTQAPLPTEEDLRLFTQYALEGGARALFYYSYGGGGTDWDSVRQDPAHWESVKRVIAELAQKVGP